VWVDKGRHWNSVDRLILWALAKEPHAASDLSKAAHIPARLISEIVLRMMRFGWVEFAATSKGALFRATAVGREVVETFETLPPVTRRVPRRISFALEPFAWRAYGLRDLKPYRPSEIAAIEGEYDVRRIVIDGNWGRLTSQDLYAAADQVLPDDEELSSIDFAGSDTLDQVALFTVVGGAIKGLPPDPSDDLVSAIRKAATAPNSDRQVKIRPARSTKVPTADASVITAMPFRPSDIVLSGSDHRDLLLEVLRQARSKFVMHSTFIRERAFAELQDEFRRAAKRGVTIDIFWGADVDERSRQNNLKAAIAINHRISADHDLRGRARVHLYSTRSHAKLLIADATGRSEGEFVAVIGSCNWLYSGFNRVEVSAVLRNPHAVASLAQEFSELVFGGATSSAVAADLTTMARSLRTHDVVDGPAKLQIVKGDGHGEFSRLARETAERLIVVGGDRLGLAAEARTIIPMMAAAKRSVEGIICYSKPSGPVTGKDARDLEELARGAGVRLVEIPNRELHGKFLLWDDDHIVVTSLNWSSADTRLDAPQAEIGLYIQGSGIADDVRRRLLADWPDLRSADKARPEMRAGANHRKGGNRRSVSVTDPATRR
jgi:phosphatidylserine/phosphatidylglycerophosphate/cardiolipin synthase-like enzyme